MAEEGRQGSQRSQRPLRPYSSEPSRHQPPPLTRLKECCRSTVAFIFSNVGVCVLMVSYNIMGAFLFRAIEGPGEVQKHYKVAAYRNHTIEKLWNITVAYNTLYPDNWTSSVSEEIKIYQQYIIEVVREGWDGTDGSQGSIMWSIEGGFLYSLTVITTIGYGHISPRTNMGKIVTIFYTIFGMPVFLLYMANMGDILAKSLKWVYAKLCICNKHESEYDTTVVWRSGDTRGSTSSGYMPQNGTGDADGYPDGDMENYGREVEIRTFSTRGKVKEKRGPSGFSPFGRRSAAPAKPSRSERAAARYAAEREHMYSETGEEMSLGSSSWRSNRSDKFDFTAISIPLTVSLVIMIALLYGGTKLFQSYEGWDILTSFYFCFISLTTIGFGDYVPGSSVESISSGNRLSFLYCSLYLMFGLALLSMCFNLMQEEVVHKVTTCAKSITITRRRDPDLEPDPD